MESVEPTLSFDFSDLDLSDGERHVEVDENSKLIDFYIGKVVGKGAQGVVRKAEDIRSGQTVALKIMDIYPGSEQLKQTKEEVEILVKLTKDGCHVNILCYYGSFYDHTAEKYVIVTEYIEGETINDYASEMRAVAMQRDPTEWETLYLHLLLITKDVVDGLLYINNKGIIHNDIKPDNIMLDKELTPKIIDFGFSCQSSYCNQSGELCCVGFNGTPAFVAPEVIESSTRYVVSDIWSLGISLYLMATGSYPHEFPQRGLTVPRIINIVLTTDPKKLESSNELLNTIVNRALIRDPYKRITAYQIQQLLAGL